LDDDRSGELNLEELFFRLGALKEKSQDEDVKTKARVRFRSMRVWMKKV